MKEIAKGRTVLVIAHRLSTVRARIASSRSTAAAWSRTAPTTPDQDRRPLCIVAPLQAGIHEVH